MAIDQKNYDPALMAGATVSVTTSAVTGNQTVGGTQAVTGAATFASTVAVTGAATLSSTLSVTGAITATAGVTSPTTLTTVSGGANTAGGNTTPAILMGSSGLGIYFGDGAPTISATKGSIYLNFTGSSTSTRLYVNNGTTNWVAVTTAS